MRARHHTNLLLCATFSLFSPACDDQTDRATPTFEATRIGLLLPCDEGSVDREQINALLRDYPRLAQELGIRVVRTCAEAQVYHEAFNDYLESLPPAEDDRLIDDDRPANFRIANADSTNLSTGSILKLPGCTGVLITHRALITAAHCVDQWSGGDRSFWIEDYTIKDFGSSQWECAVPDR